MCDFIFVFYFYLNMYYFFYVIIWRVRFWFLGFFISFVFLRRVRLLYLFYVKEGN